MPVRSTPQLAMDEKVIEDSELEAALEERQDARDLVTRAQASYGPKHDKAIGLIAKLELPAGVSARVGRFRITRRDVPARSVSFESDPRSQVDIGLIKEA